MTRTTPARRITLHLLQIFLTDVRTFMRDLDSLVPVDDAAARQVVRRKLDEDLVSRQDADEMLSHLPGDVREHSMLVFQLDLEHRVRQRLDDRRSYLDRFFLRHKPSVSPPSDRDGKRILVKAGRARLRRAGRKTPESEADGPLRPRDDRVLEVRRRAAVLRAHRPAVGVGRDARGSEIEHGLDRERHALPDDLALARRTVIRHLRLLVERRPDPVPHELAHDAVLPGLRDGLDRRSHVSNAPADHHGPDAGEKRGVGRLDQLADRLGHGFESDGARGIREVALHDGAQVEAHEVARFEDALRRRNPVDDLVVQRDADRLRIAAVSRERGLAAARRDAGCGHAVDLLGRHADATRGDTLGESLLHDARGTLHLEELGLALAGDHAFTARRRATADSTSAATASTERSPSIVTRTPALAYRSARGAVFSR